MRIDQHFKEAKRLGIISMRIYVLAVLVLGSLPLSAQLDGQAMEDGNIWNRTGVAALRQFVTFTPETDRRASTTYWPNDGTSEGYSYRGTMGLISSESGAGLSELFDCVPDGSSDHYLSTTDDAGATCGSLGWIWNSSSGVDPVRTLWDCDPAPQFSGDRYAITAPIGTVPCAIGGTHQVLGFVEHIQKAVGGWDPGQRCAFTTYDCEAPGGCGSNHPGNCDPGDTECENDPAVCNDPYVEGDLIWNITNNSAGQDPTGDCTTALWATPERGFEVVWKSNGRADISADTRTLDMSSSCQQVGGGEPYFANIGLEDKNTDLLPHAETVAFEGEISASWETPTEADRFRALVHWAGKWCGVNWRVSMNIREEQLPDEVQCPANIPGLTDPNDCKDLYKVDCRDEGNADVPCDSPDLNRQFVKMTGEPWGIYLQEEGTTQDLSVDWYQILDSLVDRGILPTSTATCQPLQLKTSAVAVRLETRESQIDNGIVQGIVRTRDFTTYERCYDGSPCDGL